MVHSFETSSIPKDRFKIIFLIIFLNGIGTLLPWHMLINADKYFVDYKLNVTNASPSLENYRYSFLSYLGIASKAPNILVQMLNMFINNENANLTYRISFTLVLQILVFLYIIILAILDSSTWPTMFFWMTMLSAVLINLANGIYQGCVYGLAARFPMKYSNSVTIGMNVSGTIASLLMILSITMSSEPKIEAIIFFSCAVAILLTCFAAQFYATKNKFYQFYTHLNYTKNNLKLMASINSCPACFEKNYSMKNNNNDCPHLSMAIARSISYNGKLKQDMEKSIPKSNCQQYLTVFRSIWPLMLNLILIYAVSLSLFPALCARVISKDNWLDNTYFLPVFCFLSFNLFATIGNFIAQYIQWPGPRYLIIFSIIRVLFIPFFLFCNYYPEGVEKGRSLPVIFEHDWIYVTGSILMALTSGYFSSLGIMYAPKCVEPKLSTTAGMMGSFSIMVGIIIGINLSLLYPHLVMHC